MTKNPEGLIIDFGGKVSFSDDEFSYGTPVIYEDINSPVPALYGKKKDCVLVENACGTMGYNPDDHFRGVTKMIELGKGAPKRFFMNSNVTWLSLKQKTDIAWHWRMLETSSANG